MLVRSLAGIASCLVLVSGILASPSGLTNPDPPSLDARKTELEIKKLQEELASIQLTPWIQVAPICIAVLSTFLSSWSAWQSQQGLRNQINQQEKDRISGLLEELGSPDHGVRIAAIQTLSDYAETHRFLVSLLKYETDQHIISAIGIAISKNPQESLSLISDSSASIYQQIYLCAGELESLNMPRLDISTLLKINHRSLNQWLDSRNSKRLRSVFEAKLSYLKQAQKITPSQVLSDEKALILEKYYQLLVALKNLIQTAEIIIEAAISANLKLSIRNAYFPGIILDGFDLSGWSFIKCNLQDASFRHSLCQGATFDLCILDHADFQTASLHDATFERVSCQEALFSKAHLIRCKFRGCNAQRAEFYGAKMAFAKFLGFSEQDALDDQQGRLWGKVLDNHFLAIRKDRKANFDHSQFGDAIGTNIRLENISLKGGDFSNAILNEAHFINTDLQGTRLIALKSRRSSFKSTQFAGNNFEKADFRGASFSSVEFTAITQFDQSEFAGITHENLKFDSTSNSFSQYFHQKSHEPYESPKDKHSSRSSKNGKPANSA